MNVQDLVVPVPEPDWQVRLRFVDGSTRTWQVSPGKRSREKAIGTVMRSAGILDESVLAGVDCVRVGEEWPPVTLSSKKVEE